MENLSNLRREEKKTKTGKEEQERSILEKKTLGTAWKKHLERNIEYRMMDTSTSASSSTSNVPPTKINAPFCNNITNSEALVLGIVAEHNLFFMAPFEKIFEDPCCLAHIVKTEKHRNMIFRSLIQKC